MLDMINTVYSLSQKKRYYVSKKVRLQSHL